MLTSESFQLEHLLIATLQNSLKHGGSQEFATALTLFGLTPSEEVYSGDASPGTVGTWLSSLLMRSGDGKMALDLLHQQKVFVNLIYQFHLLLKFSGSADHSVTALREAFDARSRAAAMAAFERNVTFLDPWLQRAPSVGPLRYSCELPS